MKWEHETWRKLYVRVTAQWLALPLSARGLADELLKYADDEGVILLGNDAADTAVARLCGAHAHERKRVKNDLKALLDDGFLVPELGALRIRNMTSAQGRTGSAGRMARKRERDKMASQAASPEASQVTYRSDGSRADARAPGSVPISSDQIPPTPQGAHAVNGQVRHDPPAESGYELAERCFLAAWAERYGETYRLNTNTGEKGDGAVLLRLGRQALEHGARAEEVMRHWAAAYVADNDPWLVGKRHPLFALEQRLNQYGAAPVANAAPKEWKPPSVLGAGPPPVRKGGAK